MNTNKQTKFYNVAIDYRAAGYPGCSISTVKADSEEQAIWTAQQPLMKHVNFRLIRASAKLSGWNR